MSVMAQLWDDNTGGTHLPHQAARRQCTATHPWLSGETYSTCPLLPHSAWPNHVQSPRCSEESSSHSILQGTVLPSAFFSWRLSCPGNDFHSAQRKQHPIPSAMQPWRLRLCWSSCLLLTWMKSWWFMVFATFTCGWKWAWVFLSMCVLLKSISGKNGGFLAFHQSSMIDLSGLSWVIHVYGQLHIVHHNHSYCVLCTTACWCKVDLLCVRLKVEQISNHLISTNLVNRKSC